MQSLYIKSTENTPSFNYNVEDSLIEIRGNSEIHDSKFYQRITDYVDVIQAAKPRRINLDVSLNHICNLSKRGLLFFMVRLKSLQVDCQCEISIAWMYPSNNHLVKAIGENLEYMVMLPIHIKPQLEKATSKEEVELAY